MFRKFLPRSSIALTASAILLSAVACSSEANREAKARIFSPEEPKPVVLAASRPIDAAALGANPELGHRVLTMGAAEALQRLGPHRLTGEASFEWRMADRRQALKETREVALQSAERFLVRNENDRDRGHEFLQIGDKSFLRIKHLPWRQRAREQAALVASRDENYGLLSSAVSMLKDRVLLALDGQEIVAGRAAQRYLLSLSDKPMVARRAEALPPPIYPEGAPSPDTRLRLDALRLSTPQSVEGRVWIDVETGVPLKSELWATLSVLSEGVDAVLHLKVAHALSDIGQQLGIEAPADFLPAEDRPNAIAAALARFGMAPSREEAAPKQAPSGGDEADAR
ncbi:MAG: hypothetical protein LBM75_06055 [Myxococcales bacterium]|jgi:hypothetical protein|nr:hypothetical protein [Myxococcales bacterium]